MAMQKKTKRQTKKLSATDVRLARLHALVETLPDGDQDKEDLLLLFAEYERVKTKHAKLMGRLRGARKLREENRRLRGALNLATYGLEVAKQQIAEQDVTIGWLRRRVGKKALDQYEREHLQALANEQRLDDGKTECNNSIC